MEINGKEYPVRFTFNTKAKFCRAKDIDLPEFSRMFDGVAKMQLKAFDNLATFFLYAFQEGARKEQSQCDLTLDDIMEWYSEDMPRIEQLLKLYAESEAKGGKVTAQP